MKDILRKHAVFFILLILLGGLALFFLFLPKVFSQHYVEQSANVETVTTTTPAAPVFVPSYIAAPSIIKGVYMTSWIAGTPRLRQNVVNLIDTTEINSIVIDIKDYSGKIVFPIEDNPALKAYGSEDVRVPDMQSFIESLHKKGIYVIGRIAVFQDAYFVKAHPELAVKNLAGTETWKDHKGISWIDPGSEEYWNYIIMLAKEAHKVGFDEINFDYIRFPSDGNMKDISYPLSSTTPKAIVLKNFFSYVHDALQGSDLNTSADLFGMTTTARDDMGIGQLLENALPYFNYVDPMVYPSHYPTTFMGYKNPEQYPYQVVQFAMQSAVTRANALASTTGQPVAILRPWLQDFGLTMDYGPTEVRDQIQATNDVGLSSWLLWSASNKYTVGALNNQ